MIVSFRVTHHTRCVLSGLYANAARQAMDSGSRGDYIWSTPQMTDPQRPPDDPHEPGPVRFQAFVLDRRSGELLKNGSRVRLQDAPLKVLRALLDRPGEIVTREELRRRLWGDDTFVDFDNGLNTAVNRLRASLGDRASTPTFIETVGRRGYRFIAPLSASGTTPATYASGSPSTASVPMRLAVLPFRQLKPDTDTEFLTFALADAVASSLSGLESLAVRSPVASARFASAVPDLTTIASALDVTLVLTGTALRLGDRVRVTTQLVEAPRGTLLWTTTADASLADMFQLTDSLVRRIVESLALPLTVRDARQLDRDVSGSGRAFELYLRANGLGRNPATWPQARDLYLESVRADPQYAPAWARLGRVQRLIAKYATSNRREVERQAEDAFRRALAINPELSLAHYLYAQLEMETGRSVEAFVRLLDRTREPRADPQLYAGLVQAARYVGLLDASREAHDVARRLERAIRTSVAHTSLAGGDYARAVADARDNDDPLEGFALAVLGETGRAIDVLTELRRRVGDNETWAAYVDLTLAFARSDRQALASCAKACLQMLFSDPEGCFEVSLLLALSREPSGAVDLLERAVEAGFSCFAALDSHPMLRTLRADPRFATLAAEIGRRHARAAEAFEKAGGLALFS
jgi:DNA-binding winged helix-turn-helix (wHTH) protein